MQLIDIEAKQVQEKRLKSEIIADFLELLREAENLYSFNYDSVNQMDKLKQDILHKFELQQMTEPELLELDPAGVTCANCAVVTLDKTIIKTQWKSWNPSEHLPMAIRNLWSRQSSSWARCGR